MSYQIMNDNQVLCPICGNNAKFYHTHNRNQTIYDCEICGGYSIEDDNFSLISNNILSSFLYYNCNLFSPIEERQFFYYIGSEAYFDLIHKENPKSILIKIEAIINWYPKNFSEKIDNILLGLAKISKYDGNTVFLIDEISYSLFFVNRFYGEKKLSKEECEEQINYIATYMAEQKYLKKELSSIILLPEGLRRIDELQKSQSSSKQAFIAMSFSDHMKEVQEKIEEGIRLSGYVPHVMNKSEHNNQIVPEILYQIKQSKFVVADFSTNNNGAYYEAGYAAGLGKEVIHICNNDKFKEDGHFDIKQKSTILWKNIDDIPNALHKRIEATIGKIT